MTIHNGDGSVECPMRKCHWEAGPMIAADGTPVRLEDSFATAMSMVVGHLVDDHGAVIGG